MTNLFYCLDCDHQFESPVWNGSNAVCPKCESTKWYDIEEETEQEQMKSRKPILPSEESPFP